MTNYEDYDIPPQQEALIEDFSADFVAAIDALSYDKKMSEVQFDFPQEIRDEFDKVVVKDSVIQTVDNRGDITRISCGDYGTEELYYGDFAKLKANFKKHLESGVENADKVNLDLLANFSAEMVDVIYHAGNHEKLKIDLRLDKSVMGCGGFEQNLDWHYDVLEQPVNECSENKDYLTSISLKGDGTVFYEGNHEFKRDAFGNFETDIINESEIKYGTRGTIYNFNVLSYAKFHSAPMIENYAKSRVTLFIGNAELLS